MFILISKCEVYQCSEGYSRGQSEPYPQTNGMVERFNGRISDILKTTRFDSSGELSMTLSNYMKVYNHHIPQKNIGHRTPIQTLKEWQKKQPDLFKKIVYDITWRF